MAISDEDKVNLIISIPPKDSKNPNLSVKEDDRATNLEAMVQHTTSAK